MTGLRLHTPSVLQKPLGIQSKRLKEDKNTVGGEIQKDRTTYKTTSGEHKFLHGIPDRRHTAARMSTPAEPPPSYEQSTKPAASSSLQVPKARNGIPAAYRRSMEDESRSLPSGWVRQFDDKSNHQFFVDTKTNPPRSIWHHPYDDEQYLSTLSTEERERTQTLHHGPDYMSAGSSTEDEGHGGKQKYQPSPAISGAAAGPSSSSSTYSASNNPTGIHKFGRKMKDKVTSSTHQEREQQREQRRQEEEQAFRAHQMLRRAMARAVETGQPQFVAKDREGHDVYIEPPQGPGAPYGARVVNPYSSGVYADPNARFVRPDYPYGRPYGGGYGGGMGMPLGLPLMGGLMGGMMMGGLLF